MLDFFFVSPNLAGSSYGWSPLPPCHKIEKKTLIANPQKHHSNECCLCVVYCAPNKENNTLKV
jgi:hypothetical protein